MTSLHCPRCGANRLKRLKSNGISPFRGYRCEGCGKRLRDRGSAVVYVIVLMVGCGFGYATVTEPGGANAPWFGTAWMICSGYALMELFRPVPRRGKRVSAR